MLLCVDCGWVGTNADLIPWRHVDENIHCPHCKGDYIEVYHGDD